MPRRIALTAERRLPAIYPFSDSVRRGGLISYSANLFKLWQRRGLRWSHPQRGASGGASRPARRTLPWYQPQGR